jgi:hypothetical protein
MMPRLERVPSAGALRALPRVLCYVNHFYGSSPGFWGKSTSQTREVRRAAVLRTLAALQALEADVTIRVCGVPGQALVPLDVEFQLEDPRLLIYESLARMCGEREGFDYFINIEDDIEVPRATFRNVLDFDREAMVNECLHPNRLEHEVCVDLRALPGWTLQERRFASHQLRPALNPHSALLVLSRAKLEYALRHVDLGFRGHVVGGPMASAYAHFHKPFISTNGRARYRRLKSRPLPPSCSPGSGSRTCPPSSPRSSAYRTSAKSFSGTTTRSARLRCRA